VRGLPPSDAHLERIADAVGVTRLADTTRPDDIGIPVLLAVRPTCRSLTVGVDKALDPTTGVDGFTAHRPACLEMCRRGPQRREQGGNGRRSDMARGLSEQVRDEACVVEVPYVEPVSTAIAEGWNTSQPPNPQHYDRRTARNSNRRNNLAVVPGSRRPTGEYACPDPVIRRPGETSSGVRSCIPRPPEG
jgi:hypothetical protein